MIWLYWRKEGHPQKSYLPTCHASASEASEAPLPEYGEIRCFARAQHDMGKVPFS
jgi:hypothetical protein